MSDRSSRFSKRLCAARLVAALAWSLVVVAPAAADDAQTSAAAEQLFRDGRALIAEGKTREACDKFAESRRLDPEPGTLLNLAVCYETLGRAASAWAAYRELETAATKRGQTKRAEYAQAHAVALEPTLPAIVFVVAEDHRVPGLALGCDGLPLGTASWNTRMPFDPGTHHVTATAPGRRAWSIDVAASVGREARVEVPLLAEESSAAATTSERASGSSPLRVAGGVVAITGAAAIATGLVFGGVAMADNTSARKNGACDASGCTHDALERIRRADDLATVSTVLTIGGVVLAAAGVTTWLLARPSSSSSSPRAAAASTAAPALGWTF